MYLDPLYIQVLPRLLNTRSMEEAQGILDLKSIDIGHRHFSLPEGISYDASLTNTGEAVLLMGQATAVLATECDRCLEPATLSITGELQGYFLFDKEKINEDEDLEEFEEVDKKGRVDIAPNILASIVFEIPTVALCGAECEGFEQVMSEEEAAAVEEAASETQGNTSTEGDNNPPHPFAALKDFKFED